MQRWALAIIVAGGACGEEDTNPAPLGMSTANTMTSPVVPGGTGDATEGTDGTGGGTGGATGADGTTMATSASGGTAGQSTSTSGADHGTDDGPPPPGTDTRQ